MKPAQLRHWAIHNTFGEPVELADAIARLGFVQADPIRSPARAQDLILRQRVPGYRAGDLEVKYPQLDVEEDFLYAYGFLPRSTWLLLHPKKPPALNKLERRVHDLLRELGEAHPSSLERHLGAQRAVNPWGGYSKASTRALHQLHWYGMVRVARREKGTRVYMPARELPVLDAAAEAARLPQLIAIVARIFAPVPEPSLRQVLSHLGSYCRTPPERTRPALAALVRSGELLKAEVDGLNYLWPAEVGAQPDEPPARVRILAPFDPLVWDRRRFEHLWGWAYRFEAYTPEPKRKLGYYAMPMLWGDQLIGWVNASSKTGQLEAEPGFIGKRPTGRAFKHAFQEEVESLARFLERSESS